MGSAEFSGSLVVRTQALTAENLSSVPGQGAKIPQGTWHGQKNREVGKWHGWLFIGDSGKSEDVSGSQYD